MSSVLRCLKQLHNYLHKRATVNTTARNYIIIPHSVVVVFSTVHQFYILKLLFSLFCGIFGVNARTPGGRGGGWGWGGEELRGGTNSLP